MNRIKILIARQAQSISIREIRQKAFPWDTHTRSGGFTLIEVMLGAAIITIAIVSLMGVLAGQSFLNANAKELTAAMNDVTRIMEEVRNNNINVGGSCTTPTADPVGGLWSGKDWDNWLKSVDGRSALLKVNPEAKELVVVTCQNDSTGAVCAEGDDPIRVSVAICWRSRNRVFGECNWDDASGLSRNDANGNGVYESTAMATTVVTCR